MILEELVGGILSLCSSLATPTPPISREHEGQMRLIFEDRYEENDEVCDGLIHLEYEEEPEAETPYYEDAFVAWQTKEQSNRRNLCESFKRSLEANIGLIAVVFILGILVIGLVFVDFNTTDSCIEWIRYQYRIPENIRILKMVGMSLQLFPLFAWFPACIVMLWGFREFKKNYLSGLLVCQVVIGSISCVYRILMIDTKRFTVSEINLNRLPVYALFVFSILCGAGLVAWKFKKNNPETSYSLFHIFFILSFAFLASCLIAYVYAFFINKYFKKTESKIQKAIIAAGTPGLILPITATAKFIILRKSSEIITPDRAFVLCYFLRGASIVLYRTMQSDFENIWLFVGLSLLHGVSNVLSKATLGLRIKMWKFFIYKCLNKTCCQPRLEVKPQNSPRIRRLNADLEIQNILFEYTTIILVQAYLSCYLVMNFDTAPWPIIKSSLIRTAIGLATDFLFNMVSVSIQIHVYDIPMRMVWFKHWRFHVVVNAFIMIIIISYFGPSLVSVFPGKNYISGDLKLRNCTSVF
ncbi:uncharacterized protein LOC114528263 [Dendronephthya gigantea]|uniref:uncharacterized protein LOC114528263 n=1 Tax=Dendronephthya gigantea TaxID=151771 RepID=UPI0010696ED2|nr:uncharacterized protein LOC114528263 [Dendronephthya gigantea]